MEHVQQDEFFMPHILSQEQGESTRIETGKPLQNQKYEIILEPSSDTDDDEVDTQDDAGFSIVSVGQHSMSNKVSPATSTKSRSSSENRTLPMPTSFAPRSPKNYKLLRKSRSAESLPMSQSNHGSTTDSIPPPPTPYRQQSRLNFVFESPKFPSTSDLMIGSLHTMTTDGTFTFPSPFSTNQSMNFGDFAPADANGVVLTTMDEPMELNIRRISEGDAVNNNAFHQSMDLGDVFDSVFDDAPRSSRSMPDIVSPSILESSLNNGKSGNRSRGSSFEHAMKIDPFEDDCVEFSPSRPLKEPIIMQTSMKSLSSEPPVDLVAQMQALQEKHKQEVNELHREIDTRKRIIGTLTKQVHDLTARNEVLSRKYKGAKESEYEYHQYKRQVARIDMMGNVIESPDASSSVQHRRKKTGEPSHVESTDPSIKEKRLEKELSGKRKPHSRKSKSKKAHENGADDIASTSSEASLALEGTVNISKMRSPKATGTTKKLRKSKRSNRTLSIASVASLEADEHPLSKAKRLKSMEGSRRSISTKSLEKERKKTRKSSRNSLSDTMEQLLSFEWKDEVKVEEKRDSKKQKHHTKSLRKAKRKNAAKSSKAKQATTELEHSTKAKNVVTTSPKKTKKSSRRPFHVMARLLISPISTEKRRKKRSKKELQESSKADSNMDQKLVAMPDL